MPLTGEYAPSKDKYAREQVEQIDASGSTEGITMRGKPIIVLTSKGATSGKLRKTPLMRVEHDGEYAVVASKGGAPQHPLWFHNLVAHPEVELQDADVIKDYVAHEASGAERDAWWERSVAAWPDYANYQTKTDRLIPVFVLTPVEA